MSESLENIQPEILEDILKSFVRIEEWQSVVSHNERLKGKVADLEEMLSYREEQLMELVPRFRAAVVKIEEGEAEIKETKGKLERALDMIEELSKPEE